MQELVIFEEWYAFLLHVHADQFYYEMDFNDLWEFNCYYLWYYVYHVKCESVQAELAAKTAPPFFAIFYLKNFR